MLSTGEKSANSSSDDEILLTGYDEPTSNWFNNSRVPKLGPDQLTNSTMRSNTASQ